MITGLLLTAFANEPELVSVPREDIEALREEVRALRESLEATRAEPSGKAAVVGYADAVHIQAGRTVDEAVAFGENIRIDGTVRGDVTAVGGEITIGSSGRVLGDAVAFGGSITILDGGELRGNRVEVENASLPLPAEEEEEGLAALIYRRLVLMLSLAGAGVLVVGLFPGRVHRIARGVEARPFWSGMVGATVSVLLTVFALLFGLLTLGLGLPVSFLGMALLAAAWLFGFVGLCQAIGDRLPFADKPHGRWLAFLVGMGLVSCVGSLPWVGMLVVFVASMMSIGAAITSRFGGDR